MIEHVSIQMQSLRSRMKMDLNCDYDSYNPAKYHTYSRMALNILTALDNLIVHDTFNHALAARISHECEFIIRTWIRLLNDYILKKLSIMEEMYVNSGHHALIREVYIKRPALMESLVPDYPYSFMNMDDEWCAWVTLLK